MASHALTVVMRGLQFLWTLLIMALVGNMIATAIAGNHNIVNYDMFVAVFSMLSLFYLIPATIREGLGVPIVVVSLDLLNTLFFLCGGIATAAYLGVHKCNNVAYTSTNKITNGSLNTAKRCHEAQASTAFLWFGFASFAASAFFSWTYSRGSVNVRPFHRGTPAMSQV